MPGPSVTATRIARCVRQILEADGLPPDALERARRFLSTGDLRTLYEAPIDENSMIQVGQVIMQGALAVRPPYGDEPVPVLPERVRSRLHALARSDGEYAEAAHYVLVQDVKARAFNRVLGDVT